MAHGCFVFSDEVGSKSGGERRTEYHDDNDEEFTLERTCTKTTEKITANRKSRLARRETRDDADQRVSLWTNTRVIQSVQFSLQICITLTV